MSSALQRAILLCLIAAPSLSAQTTGPARISGGVISGNILTKVAPTYPPIARAAHVGGTVVLHAIISKAGTIESLAVISGPPMLQGAALDAVKQWTYKPYLLNGEPTEVDTTIIVNFNLGLPPAPATTPDQPEFPPIAPPTIPQ